MPEGDTVWRAARQLHGILAGQQLTGCDIRVPRFAATDFTGDRILEVVSRGKHLLIRGEPNAAVSGRTLSRGAEPWTIHSHLKMEGLWHVYGHGEPWRRPSFKAQCVLETAGSIAVGFELGFLQVLSASEEVAALGHLGPDLLGPGWDAPEAVRRLASDPDRPIGLALLDQRNLAGLGNVYRCELCFLAGVHPLTPVAAVPDLPRMVELAHRLLHANRDRSVRSTTGRLRGDTLWVYGRARRGCLRCATAVAYDHVGDNELELRDLYYCPHCQPSRGHTT